MQTCLQVVVPVWQDDEALDGLLAQLQAWALDVWIVDGTGSAETAALVSGRGNYIAACPSRGGQIAAGIDAGAAPWLWILHADTRIDDNAFEYVRKMIATGEPCWGRFDVALPGLNVIASMMNFRSRLTRICTGDQAMFFHRSLLAEVGGYPVQPLMEDVEVSKRLKRNVPGLFRAPAIRVYASARRWRRQGVIRTVLTMWLYRWLYFRGASAEDLYRRYYGAGDSQRSHPPHDDGHT